MKSGYLLFNGEKVKFDDFYSENNVNEFKKMLFREWMEDNIHEFNLEVIHMGNSTVDVYVNLNHREFGSKILSEDTDFNFTSIVEDVFEDYLDENIDDHDLVFDST